MKAKDTKKDAEDDICYGCKPDELGENSDRVWAAVDESVKRFVVMNQKNIGRSAKEKVASASYSGGMIDMIMVVKGALGNWAVGQLLGELKRWHRPDPSDDDPEVEVNVRGGPGKEGISQEDAKELGEKIATWMADRKRDAKGQFRDPMFA